MGGPGLRERLVRGAQAQTAGQAVRLLVQIGGVAILAGTWGLELYGEWLILFAVPGYLTFSDVGLFAAAGNDMVMRVARGDREGALRVFQASSAAVTLLFAILSLALAGLVALVPVAEWLRLDIIGEDRAALIVLVLGLNTFLVAYGGILYGGFSSEGRYGEGAFALAGISLCEFLSLGTAVLLGGGPALAATAMLAARLPGTAVMFLLMRRRVPWLLAGWPHGIREVLRPLLAPAAASGALTAGLALNVQGMVLLVGAVLGPASVAVFSTLRTMSRVVIQLLTSVFSVVTPELSKAFAEDDPDRLRRLHRGGCQAAFWLAVPLLAFLALVGDPLVEFWTSGAVQAHGALLYLFLAIAGLEALWTTSFAVLYARNRHARLAAYYVLASAVAIPVAYALLEVWQLEGAAMSIVAFEFFMLFVTLRQALPAAHDTLAGWLGALVRPMGFHPQR